MGLYDTVYAGCPECGTPSGFQSKSGPCILSEYDLNTAPPDVMLDVNRHSPNRCKQCGTLFAIEIEMNVSAKSVTVDLD